MNGPSEIGVLSSGRPPGLPGGGGATGAAAGSGALQFTPAALAMSSPAASGLSWAWVMPLVHHWIPSPV
ncbi:MAG: hypothetical protein C0481_16335 [Phenylobacterium sp.]|nr:hypothetical protein [Phenylobacterium sp.]